MLFGALVCASINAGQRAISWGFPKENNASGVSCEQKAPQHSDDSLACLINAAFHLEDKSGHKWEGKNPIFSVY